MPSFAIEAVPEAVPLNESTLLDILSRAASNDQTQVKSAAQQLQNWEKHPGYYSGLQSIFANVSLPVEVRHLAIITLKNGIDKYWRKTAQNAISKDEKAMIRGRCVQVGIQEPNALLALQNAIIVAKITRHEFPHDWPDAISSMTQILRGSGSTLALPRILLIILYVVKELSTAKLQRSRVSLYGAAPDLFRALCEVYVDRTSRWMSFIEQGGDDAGGAIAAVEHSLLALRILRRLITAGYQRPAHEAEVQEMWKIARSHFAHLYALLNSHNGSLQSTTRQPVEKHIIQIAKLHLGMVREHPTAFPQLPDAIGLAQAYWGMLVEYGNSFGTPSLNPADVGTDGDDIDDIPYMERLSLNALLLLRACVKMAFNPTQTFRFAQPHEKVEREQSREAMKQSLLSEVLIREMMETLVVKFFVFRPRDLREWQQEPDEWERTQEGEGESWEHSVRLCAEKLFLDLVLNNKDFLVQPLLGVFRSVATTENTDILVKDSVYAAIGLSAPILHEHLDFDAFLTNTLAHEVQIQAQGYNMLRRRIAIVIGQWISVRSMNRSLVYQIFQHLLDPSDSYNDLVVRLTAGRQLGNVMDPWDIKVQDFAPFAATILDRQLKLIGEVPINETQLDLLNVVSTIVTRMEHHVVPFAQQILAALPSFWETAGDYVQKQTILGIITALMNSIGAESSKYHHLILPIILNALDPESETRLYLLEDVLELWSAVLTQASEPSQDLLALAPYLQPIFESASENLAKALEIEELYAVLHPSGWVEDATARLRVYQALLREKLSVATRSAILRIVELLMQHACRISQLEHFLQCMQSSGFLTEILTGLRSAYDAHQTTGPNRLQSRIDDPTETNYFCILSRALFAQSDITIRFLDSQMWPWLVSEWFSHFESIPSTTHKKLCCMGLTSLLSNSDLRNLLLGRLQELLSVWTAVTYECCELDEDGAIMKDSLVYERHEPRSDPDTPPPQPEELRRQDILYGDPVHVVAIHDLIRRALQQIVVETGGQAAFQDQWLVNVDKEVVQSFASLRLL